MGKGSKGASHAADLSLLPVSPNAGPGNAFVDFERVTPSTDVTKLNLSWREQDLPERVRTKHVHRLHPYLGKFVPQLVEIFLRKYQPRFVVDPFCGSGTTLVEATVLGMDCFGTDISLFNCLLSSVKTARYDVDRVEREVFDILARVRAGEQGDLFVNEDTKIPDTRSDWLRTWYSEASLGELLRYRSLIDQYSCKSLLRVILSRAARSARLAPHYDLDFPRQPVTEPYYCHKHDRICHPTDGALKFLHRYSVDTLRRVLQYMALRKPSRAAVLCGDSREIQFPKHDLLLTSPPYVGLIDYHEQHRYAYELFALPERKDREIGTASRGTSHAATQDYVEQIKYVFLNVARSLRREGAMVVVIHDRKDLYKSMAKELGFKQEAVIKRHVNRRTGRRSSNFFEEILIWRI